MMRMYLLLILFTFSSFLVHPQDWELQTSDVSFEISNFGSTVKGSFSSLKVSISFDPSSLTSSFINASIDIESIDTGNKTRDKHLKGQDYFDEANYKQILFKSARILPSSEKDKYIVEGSLSIKGVTKQVSIPFMFKENNGSGVFSGSVDLNRLDFGVGSSSWILGDDVRVMIELITTKTV